MQYLLYSNSYSKDNITVLFFTSRLGNPKFSSIKSFNELDLFLGVSLAALGSACCGLRYRFGAAHC
ncbi:MAG: hypothetical protein RML94_07340 [Bacteroidia bacterium]|nr:hypothetical protein [Bacteroidia bacterium]